MVRGSLGNQPRTPDAASTTGVVVVCNVVAIATFLVLPTVVDGAERSLHFTDRDVGFLSAINMAGSMVSAIGAKFWVRRVPWARAVRTALLGLACANALSLVFQDRGGFLALQCVAGFFGGSLYSLTLTVLSDTRQPDRNFGLAVAAQVVFQVMGLLAGPTLLAVGGIDVLLTGFALLCLLALPLARFVPDRGRRVSAQVTFAALLGARTLLALMGCFFFLLNAGCYWTYVNDMGHSAGLGEQQIASGLALGVSAGLLGALLASWIGARFNRNASLAIGALLIVAAAWLLAGPLTIAEFTLSSALFNFAWNYSLSYQYAAVNATDPSGHSVAVAPAFHTAGAALGPAIAALLVTPSHYTSVIWLVDAGAIVSLVCFLASARLANAARTHN